MSTNLHNEAAWLETEKANPLVVGPAPMPTPDAEEVVIKVAYAAINPADHMMQDAPYVEMPYPWISGLDVAGTVVQLGPGVTGFSIGQRVMANCLPLLTQKPEYSGFQRYVTCKTMLVAAIPDHLPLANAAVLPLAITTAAYGLFHKLRVPLPSLTLKPIDTKVLIWGGSSSCGSCAIQLAVAAGLTVVTTAGKENLEYVKELGATYAFDRAASDLQEQIGNVLRKGDVVIDCIATTSTQAICAKVLGKIGGGKLALLLPPAVSFPEEVEAMFVIAAWLVTEAPEVCEAVWHQYLPKALEAGIFHAKPDPFILQGGLSKVQEGIDMVRKGVSAKKVVIEIDAE